MKKLSDLRNRSDADSGGSIAVSKRRAAFIVIVALFLTAAFFTSTVDAGTTAARRHVTADTAAGQDFLKRAPGRSSSSNTSTLSKNSRRAATVKDYYHSDYITIDKPKGGETFYIGEKVWVRFDIHDVWDDYYTLPVMGIAPINAKSDSGDEYLGNYTVTVDDYDTCFDYFILSPDHYKPGSYCFYVWGVPTKYKDADSYDDVSSIFRSKCVFVYAETRNFHIRKLKAPSGLKVHAGRHKVQVSFCRASGASRYEIYRSTSRQGRYKKVKTTSGRSFTDRSVRSGKKYYYKVRSVRSVRGRIRSSFSSVKESERVR